MTSTDAVVFVYGTLRPGQPNHVVAARGVAASVNAHGHGLRLYAAAHRGYPYATTGDPDNVVVGTLLVLDPGRSAATLQRLDTLEGFDPDHPDRGHYLRRRWPFTTDQPSGVGPTGTTTEAWVYVAGPRTGLRSLHTIPSGDWLHPTFRPERTCTCVASLV